MNLDKDFEEKIIGSDLYKKLTESLSPKELTILDDLLIDTYMAGANFGAEFEKLTPDH